MTLVFIWPVMRFLLIPPAVLNFNILHVDEVNNGDIGEPPTMLKLLRNLARIVVFWALVTVCLTSATTIYLALGAGLTVSEILAKDSLVQPTRAFRELTDSCYEALATVYWAHTTVHETVLTYLVSPLFQQCCLWTQNIPYVMSQVKQDEKASDLPVRIRNVILNRLLPISAMNSLNYMPFSRLFSYHISFLQQALNLRGNQHTYKPLESSHAMIRILELLPGKKSEQIRCCLRQVYRNSIPYEALSYTWGNLRLNRHILINDQAHAITRNLHECLIQLRLEDSVRRLWVDAICINQADPVERSYQVSGMGNTYMSAHRVIIWLGSLVPGVGEVFEEARTSSGPEGYQHDEASQESMMVGVMSQLLSREWWTRVWTVQELVLARIAIVQCGCHSLEWDQFCSLVNQVACSTDFSREATFYDQFLALKTERRLHHDRVSRRFELLDRMYRFRHKQATQPIDKIYGFYGLLRSTGHLMPPDYEQSIFHQFQSFTVHFIRRYRSLAVVAISEFVVAHDHPSLRSIWWSSPWRNDGKVLNRVPFWTGLGDKTGGQPWSEDSFSAADHLPVPTCKVFNSEFNFPIGLKGWAVDTIAITGPVYMPNDTRRSVLEEWAILVFMIIRKSDKATLSTYHRNITAGLYGHEPAEGTDEYGNFSVPRDAACGGRRFFITFEGRMGMGPAETRSEDELWILPGCEVPVVLANKNVDREGYEHNGYRRQAYGILAYREDIDFGYIGQSYVHDLMTSSFEGGLGKYKQSLRNLRLNDWLSIAHERMTEDLEESAKQFGVLRVFKFLRGGGLENIEKFVTNLPYLRGG